MPRVLYLTQAKQIFVDVAERLARNDDWVVDTWIAWEHFRSAVLDAFPECAFVSNTTATRSDYEPVANGTTWYRPLSEAISDQRVSMYSMLLERNTSYVAMTDFQRRGVLYRQMGFWHSWLQARKIDVVFFSDTPHLPHSLPLYWIAQDLGIKTLMFNMSTIPAQGMPSIYTYLSTSISDDDCDLFGNAHATPSDHVREWVSSIQNYRAEYLPPYMNDQIRRTGESMVQRFRRHVIRPGDRPLARFGSWILTEMDLNPNGPRANTYIWPERPFWSYRYSRFDWRRFAHSARRKRRRLLKEYQTITQGDEADIAGKTLYFPLHYQPEMTTVPRGGGFADQIAVVSLLAANLPAGWSIVVKEHPSTFMKHMFGHQGRFDGFYETLAAIPRVRLLPLETDSRIVLRKAHAVATITGTSGIEALALGKPLLVFGYPWYRTLPGVMPCDSGRQANAAMARIDREDYVVPDKDELLGYIASFESVALSWNPEYVHSPGLPGADAQQSAEIVYRYIVSRLQSLPDTPQRNGQPIS